MKTFDVSNVSGIMEPSDLLERIWSAYDEKDLDSITAYVDNFRQVANNKGALLNKLHAELRGLATRKFSQYKQTSILLAGPRGKRPYLRANIWPAVEPGSPNYADLCKAYSYYFPHTHNFSFLTTAYFGHGYETEVWELHEENMNLKVGQIVPMAFLGRFTLSSSTVMRYEASRDVHIQYPPKSISVSINLMLYREADKFTTQYFFETGSGCVVGTSSQSPAYRRLTLIRLAGLLGTEETGVLLSEIERRSRDDELKVAVHDVIERRRDKAMYGQG